MADGDIPLPRIRPAQPFDTSSDTPAPPTPRLRPAQSSDSGDDIPFPSHEIETPPSEGIVPFASHEVETDPVATDRAPRTIAENQEALRVAALPNAPKADYPHSDAGPEPRTVAELQRATRPVAPEGQEYDDQGKLVPAMPSAAGAAKSGILSAGEAAMQTDTALRGDKPVDGYQPGPEAEPFTWSDLKDPNRVLAKATYQISAGAPTLAAGTAGTLAGGAVAGPVGGIAGGATAALATSAYMTLGPFYANEVAKLEQGGKKLAQADYDAAFDRALAKAGQEGAFSAASWAAFGIMPFKGFVKNMLFQAAGVQQGVAAVKKGVENIEEGKPLTKGMAEQIPDVAIGTALPVAILHGAKTFREAYNRAGTPPPGAQPGPGTPPPGASAGAQPGPGPGAGPSAGPSAGPGQPPPGSAGGPRPGAGPRTAESDARAQAARDRAKAQAEEEARTGAGAARRAAQQKVVNNARKVLFRNGYSAKDVEGMTEEEVIAHADKVLRDMPPPKRDAEWENAHKEEEPAPQAKPAPKKPTPAPGGGPEAGVSGIGDDTQPQRPGRESGGLVPEAQANEPTKPAEVPPKNESSAEPSETAPTSGGPSKLDGAVKGLKDIFGDDFSSRPAGTRGTPAPVTNADELKHATAVTAEPTPAQAEAGNYQHAHVDWNGDKDLRVMVETPKGGSRTGVGQDGKPWEVKDFPHAYGYLPNSPAGKDGKLDVHIVGFARKAFVIDQKDLGTGKFDEHKVMLGAKNTAEARAAYASTFSDGKGADRIMGVTPMSIANFKKWKSTYDPSVPAFGGRAGEAPAPTGKGKPQAAGQKSTEPKAKVRNVRKRRWVKEGETPNLIQFLGERGGLREENGELAHMGLHKRFPGFVNNKHGLKHDSAREIAAEAGYFDHLYGNPQKAMAESTVADLRAALADGDKIYPGGAEEVAARQDEVHAAGADKDKEEEGRAREAIRQALIDADVPHDADLEDRAAKIMAATGLTADQAIDRVVSELTAEELEPSEHQTLDDNQPPGWEDDTNEPEQSRSPSRSEAVRGNGEDRETDAGESPAAGGAPSSNRGEGEGQGGAEGQTGSAGRAATEREPAVERGADNRPQFVLPGAKRDLGHATAGKLKAKVPQQDVGGLFGDSQHQTDLMDLVRKAGVESDKELVDKAKRTPAATPAEAVAKAAAELVNDAIADDPTLTQEEKDLVQQVTDDAVSASSPAGGTARPAEDKLQDGNGRAPGGVHGVEARPTPAEAAGNGNASVQTPREAQGVLKRSLKALEFQPGDLTGIDNVDRLKELLSDPGIAEHLEKPFRLDFKKRPPYIAGYSDPSGTIYVHADWPFEELSTKPIVVHERIEDAAIKVRGYTYQGGHILATAGEQVMARKLGYDWDTYQKRVLSMAPDMRDVPAADIPGDLDETPYRDTPGGMALLKGVTEKWRQKRREFEELIARNEARTEKLKKEITEAMAGPGGLVARDTENPRHVTMLTRSSREKGMLQITWFDNGTPTGHIETPDDLSQIWRDGSDFVNPKWERLTDAEADAALMPPAPPKDEFDDIFDKALKDKFEPAPTAEDQGFTVGGFINKPTAKPRKPRPAQVPPLPGMAPLGKKPPGVSTAPSNLDEAVKGLKNLFEAPEDRFGPGVDPAIYAKAKVFFKKGLEDFPADDLATMVRGLINHLADKAGMDSSAIERMKPYIRQFVADVTSGKEKLNAPSPRGGVESDRGDTAAPNDLGATDVHSSAGHDGTRPAEGGSPSDQGGQVGSGGGRVPPGYAPSVGEDGNLEIPERQPEPSAGPQPDTGDGARGDQSGDEGLSPDRGAEEEAAHDASDRADLSERRRRQAAAEGIKVVPLDAKNIDDTLPMLFPEQRGDVLKAEQRFTAGGNAPPWERSSQPDAGHGFLLTNGTGTGKTFSGLGVIKRFTKAGKGQVLVVAPSQGVILNWQRAAKELHLDARILDGLEDGGAPGMNMTTYANLGLNKMLADKEWDLIVTDEAHKLSSDQNGNRTIALDALRALTYHPEGFHRRAQMILRKEWDAVQAIDAKKRPDAARLAFEAYNRKADPLIKSWEGTPRPKVLMLSASPFAYHFSLDYANGYLLDFGPDQSGGRGYNAGDARQQWYMQNLGYRMRTNRLTAPDTDVNLDIMERQVHESLKTSGALHGRQLQLDVDYDRKFALVADAIGKQIDNALTFLQEADKGKFRQVYSIVAKKFDYLSRMRLLEAIKAKHAIPYIEASLKLGRKVVVFHDYNEGGGFSPFKLELNPDSDVYVDGKMVKIKALYDEFLDRNPYVEKLDFVSLGPPITTLSKHFGDRAGIYNGTVGIKRRDDLVSRFNNDDDPLSLLIVQSAAGEFGLSMHDITGLHQRLLLNLGMPIRPVSSMQQEGRIYREGSKSDAIYRYMNTGTNWERWTFAGKIAERAGTAENLAMGNVARQIRQSFIDAFEDADDYPPEPGDGKGGKEADRGTYETMSEFERAKTHYYAQAKKTARNKAREGVDYFATPEPLGLKMVEWANLKPGEKVLEPSAGHGAISRYFPEDTGRTLVEPSTELASRASLQTIGARVVVDRFENLNVGANKFHAIVMNPPFGHGGATAMEHVKKAAQHLVNGGRLIAVIPAGPAADKAWEKLYASDDPVMRPMRLVADLTLPSVTFERAGTSVRAHVVILDKQTDDKVARETLSRRTSRDWSDAETIKDFFDRIENADMPDRLAPITKEEAATEGTSKVKVGDFEFELEDQKQGNATRFSAKPTGKLGDSFARIADAARVVGGAYIRGTGRFDFPSADARSKFFEHVAKPEEAPKAQPDFEPGNGQFPKVKFNTTDETHTKTGKRIFMVRMADKVDGPTYQAIASLVKRNGGYWSPYSKGFLFEKEEGRAEFLKAAQGEPKAAGFEAPAPKGWESVEGGGDEWQRNRDAYERRAAGGLFELGPFDWRPGEPKGRQAQDYVVANGKSNGVEFIVGVNGQGDAVIHGHGTRAATGDIGSAFDHLIDPNGNVVVHHNHPNNRGFSTQDIAMLGMPGLKSLWAHGHDGSVYRASLTAATEAGMRPFQYRQRVLAMQRMKERADDAIYAPMVKAILAGRVSRDLANEFNAHLEAMILRDAGVIDYRTSLDTDPGHQAIVDELISQANLKPHMDEAVKAIRGAVDYLRSEHATHVADDGRPGSLRGHPGELGASLERNREAAGGHGRQGLRAEASPQNDRAKKGGGQQLKLPGFERDPERFLAGFGAPIDAYHGSPHEFDRFDISKIGTGEGAQSYGPGLYFAGREGVARQYRNRLQTVTRAHNTFWGKKLTGPYVESLKSDATNGDQDVRHFFNNLINKQMRGHGAGVIPAIEEAISRREAAVQHWQEMLQTAEAIEAGRRPGSQITWTAADMHGRIASAERDLRAYRAALEGYAHVEEAENGSLYHVQIDADPDHLLDYDKPMGEQSDYVKERLVAAGLYRETTGWKRNHRGLDDGWNNGAAWVSDKGEDGYYRYGAYGGDSGEAFDLEEAKEAALDLAGMTGAGNPLRVEDFLKDLADNYGRPVTLGSGDNIYDVKARDDAAAADALRRAGIPGVRYLNQGARNTVDAKPEDHNYVVFDDSRISIKRRYQALPAIRNDFPAEDLTRLKNDLQAMVSRIAGKRVPVSFSPQITQADYGGPPSIAGAAAAAGFTLHPTIGGYYEWGDLPGQSLIALALEDPRYDPRTAAGHEAWHHVTKWLMSDGERAVLDNDLAKGRDSTIRKYVAKEFRVTVGSRLLDEMPDDELTAFAFQRYRRMMEDPHGPGGLHIALRKFFARLAELFRQLTRRLRNLRPEDIFADARQGKMADREPAAGFEAPEDRFRAAQAMGAPTPPPRDASNDAIRARMGDKGRGRGLLSKLSWGRAYAAAKDDIDPFKVAERYLQRLGSRDISAADSAYVRARASRSTAFNKLSEWVEGAGPERYQLHMTAPPQRVGRPLREIFAPLRDGNLFDQWVEYMVSKRAIEKENQGIPTGVPLDHARNVVRTHETFFGPIGDSFHRDWTDHIIQYAIDSGRISAESGARIREWNKDWIPYNRLFDTGEDEGPLGSRRFRVGNPLKRMKGSELRIENPLHTIIKNAFAVLDTAERNTVLRLLDDSVQAIAGINADALDIMRPIKMGVHPITVTEAEVAQFMRDNGIIGDPADFTIFRPNQFRPDKNTIRYFKAGKAQYRHVPEEIGNAVNGLDRHSMGVVTRMLTAPTRWLRAGAIDAPEFVGRHTYRGELMASILSRNYYVPFISMLHGVAHLAVKSDAFHTAMSSGALNASMVSMDQRAIAKIIRGAKGPSVWRRALRKPFHPLEMIRDLTSYLDNARRMGEYAQARMRGKSVAQSAYDAREVFGDYLRKGTVGGQLARWIAFFNADFEGMDRQIRALNPRSQGSKAAYDRGNSFYRTMFMTLALITLPSIALWLQNHKDPRYKQLNPRMRDLYWIWFTDDWQNVTPDVAKGFPTYVKRQDENGQWQVNRGVPHRLPKPFAPGVIFGALPERILDAIVDKDPHAFDGLLGSLGYTMTPQIIPTVLAPIIDEISNKNWFLGSPLVPPAEEQVLPKYQGEDYTSETAKLLSKAISKIPLLADSPKGPASPYVIDDYINDWTGTLGRYGIQVADAGLRAAGLTEDQKGAAPALSPADEPIIKGFVLRYPTASAEPIQRFYDNVSSEERIEKTYQRLRKEGRDNEARVVGRGLVQGIVAENGPMGKYVKMMSELHKSLRAIKDDKRFSGEDKRLLMDQTVYRMIDVTTEANRVYDQERSR